MENPESFENHLDQFKADIVELMGREPGHFTQGPFDLADLTGSDGAIWQEVKNQTLTKEELQEYTDEVKASGVPSRMTFLAMINNKALGLFLGRELEERKKRKLDNETKNS